MSLEPARSASPGRAVTIRDVARAAGVSISTVSRVLDERHRTNSAAAQRVREAVEELGYRKDMSASNLRRGETSTIGVVVPRLTDTVMAMLYEELADACTRAHKFAVVATTGDEPAAERHAVESLLRRGVDGLVLASARSQDPITESLQKANIPHVLALRTDTNSLASTGDDYLGGFLAAAHLAGLGHRRIGLISGPEHASTTQERARGFRAGLAEAGLAPLAGAEEGGSFSMEAGEQNTFAIMNRFDESTRPTALFVMNDNAAIGALSSLQRLGIRVPEDLSLVGYNDIPIAAKLPVPLTTLRVPFRQIATSAIELLLNPPSDSSQRVVRAAPTLIPRATTGQPPTA